MTTLPRLFHLQRDHDVTGVSGTGRVADGVLWPDGTVSIRWTGPMPSTVFWHSLANALHVHGHGGATRIVWAGEQPPASPATGDVRDQLLRALDFAYVTGVLGYGTPEELLAAYDASRASVDRAAFRDRIADVLAAADGWSWVPGFDKSKSPAYQGYQSRADAVLAVLPPADQATVAARRDRIAEAALAAVESALGDTLLPAAREEALAGIAAVLPPPADRAAVLREEADRIDATRAQFPIAVQNGITWATAELRRHAAECPQCGNTGACNGGPCPLRRMADEPPAEAEGDTLPAWLYRRFAVIHGAPDWEQLEDAARPYWERQARAVRRAVARSGIEQPAAGARQDGEA